MGIPYKFKIMKAILKSGKSIKITQDEANDIIDMKIKGDNDMLVIRRRFDPSKRSIKMVEIPEVVAII